MTRKAQTAYALIREIRSGFQQLKKLSDKMNADAGVTAAMQSVLEHLVLNGPQTVPQVAQARNVTRQHVQQRVDELVMQGYADFVDNPNHRRSRLVQASPAGAAYFDTLYGAELDALDRVLADVPDGELQQALEGLRRFRSVLDQI
jgi:DNA-binding MarR family transcriptional regulator